MRTPAALRTLARDRWFTATAILTIALGIAVNAAIFSLVDRALIRTLPYPDADRLVWLASLHAVRGQYSKSSGADFAAWQDRRALFESVEAFMDRPFTITGTDRPEAVSTWLVTPTLFATLGANAAIGRTFSAGDGEPGRDQVVVLSEALWRRRFLADPGVVGRVLQLDGRDHTIVGVMPASFAHPHAVAQLWAPLAMSPAMLQDRKQRAFRVIGRLRQGVTRAQAQAELAAIDTRRSREFPDTHDGWATAVRPLRDFYLGDVSRLLWILQGTALILLTIAAANIASLVLVRAAGRQRELAIRTALGAGRLQLFRLHLAEGLAVAGAGAAAGLVLAAWAVQALRWLLSTRLPAIATAGVDAWIDGRVIAAAAAAAIVIGALFGCAPLVRAARPLAAALQAGGRGSAGDRRTRLMRHGIVAAQVALSVALLVGAGLLVRSFTLLQRQDFGFRTEGVITAQITLPMDRYPDPVRTGAFLGQLVAEIAALPGVEAAGAVNTLPLTGFNALRPHQKPGSPPDERMAEFRVVTPDYFRALEIPVRRGRVFDDRDRAGAQAVIVVNETLARRVWPATDPIGQTLLVGDGLTPSPKVVVGVVGDVRHHDLARAPEPEIYRPAYQAYWPFFGIVARAATTPEALERALREALGRVDRNVPIGSVKAFDELADSTWAWRRSTMALLSTFAAGALFLAFLGVYGITAYSVAQRSREIGIRMALGARPADVARGVLRQGAWLSGLGVGAGLTLSWMLAGLLGALLFGVTPLDPLTFAGVSLLTLAVSLLATAMPAVAATRVDPTTALRE